MRKIGTPNIYPNGKITPPVAGTDLITRSGLVERLVAEAKRRSLTLIIAPAGYGKTALLTALFERIWGEGINAFWYNCDRSDVVPNRLSTFLRETSQAETSLADEDSLGFETSVTASANLIAAGLERVARQTIVVIENYHLAQSQETDALVEGVLDAESPYLHLLISSRAKPTFASRKLMISGRATEFRARDLAFSQEELTSLAGTLVPELSPANLVGVLERTEGWPVAIRLFLLALKDGADRQRMLEEISARDADVAEYLTEEVLRGQPKNVQSFLIATSFLEQFNEGVCTAVVPGTDTREVLELLERNNLFIVKLESESGWYRYHPIFRQYLMEQFERLPISAQGKIRRAAGQWFQDNGLLAEAVDLALMSGDPERARELLTDLAPDLVSVRGDLARFLQLISRFPKGMIEDDPTLLFWQAWAMFFARRYREAASHVANLHRSAQTKGNLEFDEGLRTRIGLLDTLSAIFTDDMVTARRTATYWLSNSTGVLPFDRSTVAVALVLADLAFLDMPAARRALDISQRAIAESESAYGAAWVCGIGMAVDLIGGEPRQALARLDALDASWAQGLKTPSNISSTLSLLAAAAFYHLGETEKSEALVKVNMHRLAEHGVTETAALGLAACLRITALRDGVSQALALERKLETTLSKAYAPRLVFTLRYERVLLLFRSGRIEDAMEEASAIADIQPLGERRKQEDELELPSVRELRQIVAARVSLADQAWNEALRVLAGLISSARHGGRNLRLVQALILKAAVHYGQSDGVKAVRSFLDAIAVARDRELFQIFIDDAQICRPLVAAALAGFQNSTVAGTQDLQFLRKLEERLGLERRNDCDEIDLQAPLEPLTPREQLMLELLHSGLRNREIAGRLSMSEATVKWHLYNLYSKLGVNNRTAAIHRARTLGLVAK